MDHEIENASESDAENVIDLRPLVENIVRQNHSEPLGEGLALDNEVRKYSSKVKNELSNFMKGAVGESQNEIEDSSIASISIGDFKRIREKIVISELASINYFVGKNGSGKSSVLWAIAGLTNIGILTQYLHGLGNIEMRDLNDVYSAKRSSADKISMANNGNIILFSHGYGRGSIHDPERGEMVFDYNLDKIGRDAEMPFLAMNGILEELKEQDIRIMRPNGEFSSDIAFTHDGYRVSLINLADGLKAMIELNHFLSRIQRKIYDIDPAKRSCCFYVLIEEPENHLHPSYQKLIPELLKKYVEEISKLGAHVRFFVTTHSPFVIGAASKISDQKVYILDSGKLVSYDAKTQATVEVIESSGYSGPTCAWVVSRMLGADVVDLGYPENYCLLEENSLYQLLKACVEKGILANYQFIAANGASVEATLEEKIDELATLDTLIKCNPYYWNTYRVIMDNTDRKDIEKPLKIRVEQIRNRLGERFVELSKDKLEDYVNRQRKVDKFD